MRIPGSSSFDAPIQRNTPSAPAAPTPAPRSNAIAKPDGFDPPKVTGGVNISPGSISGNAQLAGSGQIGSVGVSGSVKVDANLDQEVTHENGYTTLTITANASLTAEGKLDLKAVSIGGSESTGANVTYQVKMTDADYARLKAGEIPPPNPLDPSTIPDGGSVRLDESQFQGTSLELGFRYNAANLEIGGTTKDTAGTSLLVQRNGSSVQVTAGPTEVLENDVSLKLGVGPVSVELGNKTTLSDFDLRTASFDLGSADGQAAFSAFAQSGQVPIADQPGVSNVLHVESIDFDSASDLGVHLGPVAFDLGGQENTGHEVITTRPDGTGTDSAQLRYSDGPTVEIQRGFDANGNWVDGQNSYALTFDTTDPSTRSWLLSAFTGQEVSQDATGSGPIRISLTEDQLAQLQARAQEWVNNPAGIRSDGLQYDLATAQSPLDAAQILARSIDAQPGEANDFYQIWSEQQTEGPLPGTVTVG